MPERAAYSYRSDPAVPPFPDDKPVFFFDGVCVLCTGYADFVLRADRRGDFRIAAAQSPLGQAIFRHYGLSTDDFSTNLLLIEGRPLFKSSAFIAAMVRLPAPWPVFAVMRIAPTGFRDWVYDWVARNRYGFFGRRAACRLPTAEEAGRFL